MLKTNKLIILKKPINGFGSFLQQTAKLIKADAIADKVAKAIGHEDCGCSNRAAYLNNPNLLINKIFFKKQNNEKTHQ